MKTYLILIGGKDQEKDHAQELLKSVSGSDESTQHVWVVESFFVACCLIGDLRQEEFRVNQEAQISFIVVVGDALELSDDEWYERYMDLLDDKVLVESPFQDGSRSIRMNAHVGQGVSVPVWENAIEGENKSLSLLDPFRWFSHVCTQVGASVYVDKSLTSPNVIQKIIFRIALNHCRVMTRDSIRRIIGQELKETAR